MSITVQWLMDFAQADSPTLSVQVHNGDDEVMLKYKDVGRAGAQPADIATKVLTLPLTASRVRPPEVAGLEMFGGYVIERQAPLLRKHSLLEFEALIALAVCFRATADVDAIRRTVGVLSAALADLLAVELPSYGRLTLRSFLAGRGDDFETRCLVIDPAEHSNRPRAVAVPYWLNYLLRDVGWNGAFHLFVSNASSTLPLEVRGASPATNGIRRLGLALDKDVKGLSSEFYAALSLLRTNVDDAEKPFDYARLIATHEDGSARTLTWPRSFSNEQGASLSCWTTRSGGRSFVVMWQWQQPSETNSAERPHWLPVGQVAPDDLAAVPVGGRLTAVLEVDVDGRVWTRVENDRQEPMAILVDSSVAGPSARPGVTRLEVSNVAWPDSLNAGLLSGNGHHLQLDWFSDRVVSDRLVVNRVPVRPLRRSVHVDVWGGEDIADYCATELRGDQKYLDLIPSEMPELRAFVNNCLKR